MAHSCNREDCERGAVNGPKAKCFVCKKLCYLGCYGITPTLSQVAAHDRSKIENFTPTSNIQFVCNNCISSPVHSSQPSFLDDSINSGTPNKKERAKIVGIMNEVVKLQEQLAAFQSSSMFSEMNAKLESIDMKTTEIKSNTEAVLCEVNAKSSKPTDENIEIRFGATPNATRPFRPQLNHLKTPSYASFFHGNATPAKTPSGSAKRQRVEKPRQPSKPIVPSPKVGTNANAGGLIAVPPKPAPKKREEKSKYEKAVWISRLPTTTTEDEVSDYIGTIQAAVSKDFNVHKLVTKGRPLSELSFISFRIACNVNDFAVLNDPGVWPKGVLVREFMESKPVTLGAFLPNNLNQDDARKPTENSTAMEIQPESPNKLQEEVVIVDS